MRVVSRHSAFLGVLASITLAPRLALAVQSHGGAEGLVAHELGHILFTAGLIYVLVAGGASRWGRAGRNQYRWFLILAIAWNALTFTSHFLATTVHNHQILRGPTGPHALLAEDGWDWLFYLTYLDHLLLVPALLLLLVALVRWWRSEGEAS